MNKEMSEPSSKTVQITTNRSTASNSALPVAKGHDHAHHFEVESDQLFDNPDKQLVEISESRLSRDICRMTQSFLAFFVSDLFFLGLSLLTYSLLDGVNVEPWAAKDFAAVTIFFTAICTPISSMLSFSNISLITPCIALKKLELCVRYQRKHMFLGGIILSLLTISLSVLVGEDLGLNAFIKPTTVQLFRYLLPTILARAAFDITKNYLFVQRKYSPVLMCLFTTFWAHMGLLYLFLLKLESVTLAIGLSYHGSFVLLNVLLSVVMKYGRVEGTWAFGTKGEFLKEFCSYLQRFTTHFVSAFISNGFHFAAIIVLWQQSRSSLENEVGAYGLFLLMISPIHCLMKNIGQALIIYLSGAQINGKQGLYKEVVIILLIFAAIGFFVSVASINLMQFFVSPMLAFDKQTYKTLKSLVNIYTYTMVLEVAKSVCSIMALSKFAFITEGLTNLFSMGLCLSLVFIPTVPPEQEEHHKLKEIWNVYAIFNGLTFLLSMRSVFKKVPETTIMDIKQIINHEDAIVMGAVYNRAGRLGQDSGDVSGQGG